MKNKIKLFFLLLNMYYVVIYGSLLYTMQERFLQTLGLDAAAVAASDLQPRLRNAMSISWGWESEGNVLVRWNHLFQRLSWKSDWGQAVLEYMKFNQVPLQKLQPDDNQKLAWVLYYFYVLIQNSNQKDNFVSWVKSAFNKNINTPETIFLSKLPAFQAKSLTYYKIVFYINLNADVHRLTIFDDRKRYVDRIETIFKIEQHNPQWEILFLNYLQSNVFALKMFIKSNRENVKAVDTFFRILSYKFFLDENNRKSFNEWINTIKHVSPADALSLKLKFDNHSPLAISLENATSNLTDSNEREKFQRCMFDILIHCENKKIKGCDQMLYDYFQENDTAFNNFVQKAARYDIYMFFDFLCFLLQDQIIRDAFREWIKTKFNISLTPLPITQFLENNLFAPLGHIAKCQTYFFLQPIETIQKIEKRKQFLSTLKSLIDSKKGYFDELLFTYFKKN